MARRLWFLSLVWCASVITALPASTQVMPSPLQVSETAALNGTFTGTWTFNGTSGQGAWNNGASATLIGERLRRRERHDLPRR